MCLFWNFVICSWSQDLAGVFVGFFFVPMIHQNGLDHVSISELEQKLRRLVTIRNRLERKCVEIKIVTQLFSEIFRECCNLVWIEQWFRENRLLNLFDTKRRNFLFFAVCGESGAVEEVRHGEKVVNGGSVVSVVNGCGYYASVVGNGLKILILEEMTIQQLLCILEPSNYLSNQVQRPINNKQCVTIFYV